MNSSVILSTLLSALLNQLPLFVVSLIGIVVSLARWHHAPAASRWTLASSLLSLLICVAGPVAQGLVMEYTRGSVRVSAVGMGFYFTALSFVLGTLRAVSIGMLLVAVYVGRASTTSAGTLPPPAGYTPSISP